MAALGQLPEPLGLSVKSYVFMSDSGSVVVHSWVLRFLQIDSGSLCFSSVKWE